MEKKGYTYSGLGFWARGGSLSGKTSVAWLRKAVDIAEKMGDEEVMTYVFRNDTGKGPEFQLFFGKTNKAKLQVKSRLDKLTMGGTE